MGKQKNRKQKKPSKHEEMRIFFYLNICVYVHSVCACSLQRYIYCEHFNSCFEIRDFSSKMASQTLGVLLFLIIMKSFVTFFSWEVRTVRTLETLKSWILSRNKTVQKTWKKVPVLNWTSLKHRINMIKRQMQIPCYIFLGFNLRN